MFGATITTPRFCFESCVLHRALCFSYSERLMTHSLQTLLGGAIDGCVDTTRPYRGDRRILFAAIAVIVNNIEKT